MSQTVERALSILDFVADRPKTLTEVTDHLETHKSTALRLLQTLVMRGYARHLEDGRYSIGFRLIAVAQNAVEQIDLRNVAHPHLIRLSEKYGHTIHLAELVNDEIYYVDKVDGHGALKLQSRVGRAAELHTAGVSKAVLAHLAEPERSRLLKRANYQRFTTTTLTSPAALAKDLEQTVERGWAEDDGEFEDFIGCVAVPIQDDRGQVHAGLSITALKALAPLEMLRGYVPDLTDTAAAIAQEMGWGSRT